MDDKRDVSISVLRPITSDTANPKFLLYLPHSSHPLYMRKAKTNSFVQRYPPNGG
jgi:hypothetical protein